MNHICRTLRHRVNRWHKRLVEIYFIYTDLHVIAIRPRTNNTFFTLPGELDELLRFLLSVLSCGSNRSRNLTENRVCPYHFRSYRNCTTEQWYHYVYISLHSNCSAGLSIDIYFTHNSTLLFNKYVHFSSWLRWHPRIATPWVIKIEWCLVG